MKILSKILFAFLVILSFSVGVSAQNPDDDCHKSNEGTDFWFGFMESRNYNSPHYLEIMVCAREQTTFTLTVGPQQTPIGGVYTVESNSSIPVRIPEWQIAEADTSEFVQDKGLHLVSVKPVTVFALNWDRNSNDIATIFPTNTLGSEYFAICYEPSVAVDQFGKPKDGRNSEFVIVAAEDNTKVSITPSVETDLKKPAGIPFEVLLNKGQVYQVQSKNEDNWTTEEQGDLTGSYITSDKNIALFSGSLAAKVPAGSMGHWDHLYEQVPPVHAWGREFYTVPLKLRKWDRTRILASQDNTVVSVEPELGTYILNKGQFKEFLVENSKILHITSDKRILVAQYSLSQSEDVGYLAGGNNEPFMIIVSPLEQMRNNAIFISYPGQETYQYYINVICKPSEAQNIVLDGKHVEMLDATNGIWFQQVKLENGVHTLENSNTQEGLLATAYSFGANESYGYPAAFGLNKLLDLGESLNFAGDTILFCYGEEGVLDAGANFTKYQWSTGDTTRTIAIKPEDVETGDKIWLTVYEENGCSQTDTVTLFVSHPETDLGVNDTTTCAPFTLILDAGAGFQDYSWSTGQTTQIVHASQTGDYRVTVTDRYGCKASDEVKLVVHPVPEINFEGPSLVCDSKEATISVSLTGADPSNWDFPGSTRWSTGHSGQPSLDEIDKTRIKVSVNDWGEYLIYYHLTTKDSCYVVKEFKIGFYETPTANFEFPDDPGNSCGDYNREIKFTGIASTSANFIWDFDGSLITDTLDGRQHYMVSLGLHEQAEISLVVDDHGCISPVFALDLATIPDFKIHIDKNKGCDTLTVNFNAELLVGESIDFTWNFDDDPPGTGIKTKHKYKQPGLYDIRIDAVNNTNGCRAAWLFPDTIKVYRSPVARMSVDPDECYSDTLDILYLNNIDSSLCTWIPVNGIYIIDDRNDSVRVVLDKQRGEISLVVEEYGCVGDTVTSTVDRRPDFDFKAFPEEGCQPLDTYTQATSRDENITFLWMTTKPYPIGKSQLYSFPWAGQFDIAAIAYSNITGCRDTLIKSQYITVHPKPVAEFEVDHPAVYVDNAEIRFTNLSYGADLYSWNFDDGHLSGDIDPIYTYLEAGTYFPTLIASSNFGCRDTATAKINVIPYRFFAPNAFRPDSEIEENRYFMPLSEGVDPEKINVKIFDRLGQLIFESKHLTNKWDGKMRNGNSAPMGNYVWIADYIDLLGFSHQEKGQVLLVR